MTGPEENNNNIFRLCLRKNGHETSSRLAGPGPQWGVAPRDDTGIN